MEFPITSEPTNNMNNDLDTGGCDRDIRTELFIHSIANGSDIGVSSNSMGFVSNNGHELIDIGHVGNDGHVGNEGEEWMDIGDALKMYYKDSLNKEHKSNMPKRNNANFPLHESDSFGNHVLQTPTCNQGIFNNQGTELEGLPLSSKTDYHSAEDIAVFCNDHKKENRNPDTGLDNDINNLSNFINQNAWETVQRNTHIRITEADQGTGSESMGVSRFEKPKIECDNEAMINHYRSPTINLEINCDDKEITNLDTELGIYNCVSPENDSADIIWLSTYENGISTENCEKSNNYPYSRSDKENSSKVTSQVGQSRSAIIYQPANINNTQEYPNPRNDENLVDIKFHDALQTCTVDVQRPTNYIPRSSDALNAQSVSLTNNSKDQDVKIKQESKREEAIGDQDTNVFASKNDNLNHNEHSNRVVNSQEVAQTISKSLKDQTSVVNKLRVAYRQLKESGIGVQKHPEKDKKGSYNESNFTDPKVDASEKRLISNSPENEIANKNSDHKAINNNNFIHSASQSKATVEKTLSSTECHQSRRKQNLSFVRHDFPEGYNGDHVESSETNLSRLASFVHSIVDQSYQRKSKRSRQNETLFNDDMSLRKGKIADNVLMGDECERTIVISSSDNETMSDDKEDSMSSRIRKRKTHKRRVESENKIDNENNDGSNDRTITKSKSDHLSPGTETYQDKRQSYMPLRKREKRQSYMSLRKKKRTNYTIPSESEESENSTDDDDIEGSDGNNGDDDSNGPDDKTMNKNDSIPPSPQNETLTDDRRLNNMSLRKRKKTTYTISSESEDSENDNKDSDGSDDEVMSKNDLIRPTSQNEALSLEDRELDKITLRKRKRTTFRMPSESEDLEINTDNENSDGSNDMTIKLSSPKNVTSTGDKQDDMQRGKIEHVGRAIKAKPIESEDSENNTDKEKEDNNDLIDRPIISSSPHNETIDISFPQDEDLSDNRKGNMSLRKRKIKSYTMPSESEDSDDKADSENEGSDFSYEVDSIDLGSGSLSESDNDDVESVDNVSEGLPDSDNDTPTVRNGCMRCNRNFNHVCVLCDHCKTLNPNNLNHDCRPTKPAKERTVGDPSKICEHCSRIYNHICVLCEYCKTYNPKSFDHNCRLKRLTKDQLSNEGLLSQNGEINDERRNGCMHCRRNYIHVCVLCEYCRTFNPDISNHMCRLNTLITGSSDKNLSNLASLMHNIDNDNGNLLTPIRQALSSVPKVVPASATCFIPVSIPNKQTGETQIQYFPVVTPTHQIPIVQPVQQLPTIQSVQQFPTVQKAQQLPTVQPAQQLPIIQPSQQLPTVVPAQQLSTIQSFQELPTIQPVQQLPIVQRMKQPPTFVPAQQLPTIQPTQQLSTMQPLQQLPTIQPNKQLPTSQFSEQPLTMHLANLPTVQSVQQLATVQPTQLSTMQHTQQLVTSDNNTFDKSKLCQDLFPGGIKNENEEIRYKKGDNLNEEDCLDNNNLSEFEEKFTCTSCSQEFNSKWMLEKHFCNKESDIDLDLCCDSVSGITVEGTLLTSEEESIDDDTNNIDICEQPNSSSTKSRKQSSSDKERNVKSIVHQPNVNTSVVNQPIFLVPVPGSSTNDFQCPKINSSITRTNTSSVILRPVTPVSGSNTLITNVPQGITITTSMAPLNTSLFLTSGNSADAIQNNKNFSMGKPSTLTKTSEVSTKGTKNTNSASQGNEANTNVTSSLSNIVIFSPLPVGQGRNDTLKVIPQPCLNNITVKSSNETRTPVMAVSSVLEGNQNSNLSKCIGSNATITSTTLAGINPLPSTVASSKTNLQVSQNVGNQARTFNPIFNIRPTIGTPGMFQIPGIVPNSSPIVLMRFTFAPTNNTTLNNTGQSSTSQKIPVTSTKSSYINILPKKSSQASEQNKHNFLTGNAIETSVDSATTSSVSPKPLNSVSDGNQSNNCISAITTSASSIQMSEISSPSVSKNNIASETQCKVASSSPMDTGVDLKKSSGETSKLIHVGQDTRTVTEPVTSSSQCVMILSGNDASSGGSKNLYQFAQAVGNKAAVTSIKTPLDSNLSAVSGNSYNAENDTSKANLQEGEMPLAKTNDLSSDKSLSENKTCVTSLNSGKPSNKSDLTSDPEKVQNNCIDKDTLSSSNMATVVEKKCRTGKPKFCPNCKRALWNTRRSFWEYHLEYCKTLPFHCKLCYKGFKCKSYFDIHSCVNLTASQKKEEDKYKCHICATKLCSQGGLRRHLRHVHEKIPRRKEKRKIPRRICEICGKVIISTFFKVHMSTHTGQKDYQCDICGFKCNRPDNLITHKRMHTGEKPFECDVCGKTFTRGDNMKNHIRKMHS